MPVPYAGTKGFLPLFSGVNALKNEGGAFEWGRFLWKNVSSGKVFGGGGGVDSYEILGKKVSDVTGWNYLVSLGFSLQVPRPAHENRATPEEQEAFKKKLWNSSKKSKKRIRKK